ncbi:senescence/dehydration-associated protein At4g35985, chloroplastic [Amborella trichopoda]|nr:senescence/dehydration-associated protein At4g35985, chloroplastic [Amborella trichopoda]|eukprot:XP_006853695.2 senescence/dehydration-associated protein At4g35985, chloroplastic [Amborella trichopoda]
MGCFRPSHKNRHPPSQTTLHETTYPDHTQQQLLFTSPYTTAYLIDPANPPLELTRGDFSVLQLTRGDEFLATIIQIGDLLWPLAKDEPVVKLDWSHYLFSFKVSPKLSPGFGRSTKIINYGVTFSGGCEGLDELLAHYSCFIANNGNKSEKRREKGGNWDEREREREEMFWGGVREGVGEYNGVVLRAMEGGSGEVVDGVFKCTEAYCNEIRKGGHFFRERGKERREVSGGRKNTTRARRSIKRARKLSKMTEKMSLALLNGVELATGSIAGPLIRSAAGKKLTRSVPGEVLLGSLDAVNTVMDSVETAGRKALSSTSRTTSRLVANRFGEDAGEVTGDIMATAGHCMGTAWNVFKIRKAINPASKSNISSAMLKRATKKQ